MRDTYARWGERREVVGYMALADLGLPPDALASAEAVLGARTAPHPLPVPAAYAPLPKGGRSLASADAPRPGTPPSAAATSRQPGPPARRLIVRMMDEVEERAIGWLWFRWLAAGKLHVLDGHGGDGKSSVTAELAAAFSTGRALTDGSPGRRLRSLFLLAEDSPEDVFKPRLRLFGADRAMVGHVDTTRDERGRELFFDLGRDVAALEQEVAEGGYGLVVVDPLSAFMRGADRNREGDVRDLLTPLAGMAHRTGVAVLCVCHLAKGGQGDRAAMRMLGSVAFVNAARLVWMLALAPEEGVTRRVLGVTKTNYEAKPRPLEWSRQPDGAIR